MSYLSAEQLLERAPLDCEERDVEAFGGKVRIRGLTAAQTAQVKQASLNLSGRNPTVAWGEMEMMQFRLGVIEPKLSPEQVKTLHLTSGASFAKVIAALDEISGTDKEALSKAQQEFQEPAEREAVSVPSDAGAGDRDGSRDAGASV